MCQKRRKQHFDQDRTFCISSDYNIHTQDKYLYPTNFIKTSRYTLIDFLPYSLLLQFKRYANIYFLLLAILQSIEEISPLNPFVAIAPLVFVLAVSMTREGYEDYYRHKSDKQLNSSETIRIENNEEKIITWKDILVGDIIKVKNNEAFPADLMVLASSYENGNCYIETGALDGEKNMKPKQAIKQTYKAFKNGSDYKKLNVEIGAKKPTQDLYQYEGHVVVNQPKEYQTDKILVNHKSLLLRGAYLRNTEFIIGVVVYTGLDTKIMKNAEPGKLKVSNIERKMNLYILGILVFQLVCSGIMAICSQGWINSNYDLHEYIGYDEDDNSGIYGFKNFFTYFILFNTMIPISLMVSLEIVKLCQAFFIIYDEEMYVAARDRKPTVMTSTINEELGQVEYIFSDKTGTLTCNVMEYKIGIIGNQEYGSLIEEIDQESPIKKQKQSKGDEEFSLTKFTFKDKILNGLLESKQSNFDVNMVIESEDKKSKLEIKDQYDLAYQYFTLLSTGHECIVQKKKNQDMTDISKISYGGPSPDEITLVDAAKNLGFAFIGSSSNSVDLNVNGELIQYELLKSFEFDSDRKRMSVIVRDKNTQVIRMYTKGADSIIRDRLAPNQKFLEFANEKLHEFSVLGLRTLLMAVKVLSEEEYQAFDKSYNGVSQENRDQEQKNLQNKIETNLHLIGASAVEDKLQYRVPETIFDLIRANIKIWMLTGDKLETAENIAKSCKLIQDDFQKIYLTQQTEEDLKSHLFGEADQIYQDCMKNNKRKGLLVEGTTLAILLSSPRLVQKFVEITKDCESVVCCRVTPKQKALVVRTIKNALQKITLAIGDGANDVNMIQEAHIGVGIYGNEGMRAVQSSDFALGEFQCLWRLLLVHGRWSYIRNSEMIVYFFYKNMLFTIPHLFYAFSNGFTGQPIFDDLFITLYNMVFTALPLLARGIFDQDVNYKTYVDPKKTDQEQQIQLKKKEKYVKNKIPELYYIGQQKQLFSLVIFLNWMSQGIVQSFVIYIITYFTLQNHIFDNDGYDSGLWAFSLIQFTAIILVASIKLAIYTKFWTVFNYIAFWVTSILCYFLVLIVSEWLSFTYVQGTPLQMLSSAYFYLIVLLSTGSVFMVEIIVFTINKTIIKFTKNDILRIFMRQNNNNKKKKEILFQMPDESMAEKYLQSFTSISQSQLKEIQQENNKFNSKSSKNHYSQVRKSKNSQAALQEDNIIKNPEGQVNNNNNKIPDPISKDNIQVIDIENNNNNSKPKEIHIKNKN